MLLRSVNKAISFIPYSHFTVTFRISFNLLRNTGPETRHKAVYRYWNTAQFHDVRIFQLLENKYYPIHWGFQTKKITYVTYVFIFWLFVTLKWGHFWFVNRCRFDTLCTYRKAGFIALLKLFYRWMPGILSAVYFNYSIIMAKVIAYNARVA